MKAHLIRTSDFSQENLERIKGLLNAFEGPMKFSLHQEVFTIESNFINPELMLETIHHWRIKNKISNDDFVCLYTETRLVNNFFTFGDGRKNFLIHSGDWKVFGAEDPVYADAYLLYSNVLKEVVYNSNREILFSKLHKKESRGCYMDLCINKSEIFLKLRTADICSDCLQDIKNSSVDSRLLSQILDAFEGLRKQLLFRSRFEIDLKPSRVMLNNKKKFLLPEFGNVEFKFSPLRKAIYKLFLENKKGFYFTEFPDCMERLLENYTFFQSNKTKKSLEETMRLVCDPFSDRMHEEISKINAEITLKLGDKTAHFYKILGARNEKRRVLVAGLNL